MIEATGPSARGINPAALVFELQSRLLVARAVAAAALARTESRGAHQRDDYTGLSEDWTRNQIVSLEHGKPGVTQGPLIPAQEAAA